MSFANGGRIVTDGLVLSLDASDRNSYISGSTTWNDLSGNNNHATLFNNPTYNDYYLGFNGTNQYGRIIYDSVSMSPWVSSQTISFWAYTTTNAVRRNLWDQAYGGFGTWTHEIGGGINYFYGTSGVNDLPYTARGSGAITTSVWNNIVSVRDVLSISWYVNGSLRSTVANIYGAVGNTTANIRIALGYTNNYWDGNIATVSAYNKALTASEVLQNYNASKSRFNLK
jgi:hypothetical protein